MRTVLMINGPVPPEGKEFCPVCVMLTKDRAEKHFKPEIEEGLRDTRTTEPLVLDFSETKLPDPQFAEVVGISVLSNLGLLRVCWGHVMSAQLTQLPPAMAGQMPGVPSLGR